MSTLFFSRFNPAALVAAGLALCVSPALGHITMSAPNGGEQFEVGSVVTITWQITIAHNTLNWDLEYSTVDPECPPEARSCVGVGPYTEIEMNVPPGDTSVGSIHTYDWTIPDDVNATVWVKVTMDNSATDYTDHNDAPFSIIPASIPGDLNGDGTVGIEDFLDLLAAWGPCPEPCPPSCPADLDDDCDVAITDLLILLANWG